MRNRVKEGVPIFSLTMHYDYLHILICSSFFAEDKEAITKDIHAMIHDDVAIFGG